MRYVHRHSMHACSHARARAHMRCPSSSRPPKAAMVEPLALIPPLCIAPPQVGSEFRGVWNVGRGIMNVTHGAAEFPGAEDKVCAWHV